MSQYILQRLLGMLVVMFVVVTIVFIIIRIAPGDPAAVMLGPDATAQDVATLRTRLGLDQPLIVQYGIFFGQLLQGDLGESIFLNRPVLSALADRAEPTFFLTLFSILIAALIAIPVGILSAYWRGSRFRIEGLFLSPVKLTPGWNKPALGEHVARDGLQEGIRG